MAAPEKPMAMLAVEFPCSRRCLVEADLSGVENMRYSLGQMLSYATSAHDAAHGSEPVKVFRWRDDAIVRAGAL